MKLIADSGSTKTDWALIDNNGGETQRIQTDGLNPFHLSDEDIHRILTVQLLGKLPKESITKVDFYGTGCTLEQSPRMAILIGDTLKAEEVNVYSDLVGAARAVCGRRKGIACILGTGSNSCLYDGRIIVSNIPPLGYILGDEGSGAAIGKMFLSGIFKGKLDSDIRDLYLRETRQTYDDVIRKVYSEPLANRYLASTALFIHKHKESYLQLKQLVEDNFKLFIERNVDSYNRKDLPLGFVGSIAWFFKDELSHVIKSKGYRLGQIIKSPIDGLIAFKD